MLAVLAAELRQAALVWPDHGRALSALGVAQDPHRSPAYPPPVSLGDVDWDGSRPCH